MEIRVTVFYLGFLFINNVISLDNGLARVPPMGWLSWEAFACELDCDQYPKQCISERLYMEMADRLASDGYKELGYEYVNVDDCWSELERDPVTKELVPDKKRFPSGIKALADYVHSKGLKFGIYGDIGTKTCGGYPGFTTENKTTYFDIDTATFASWGIDSLKVDGCYANTTDFTWLYPKLGKALNNTGRPIVYSCSWPAYQVGEGLEPDYALIAENCNLWRNYDDILDSWTSVTSIIDFYAKNQHVFEQFNGPGAFFDPDMVVIGNYGLSYEQSEAQLALWAILSAPLLMSNDLRLVREEHRKILQNKYVIQVNQDKLGLMGKQVVKDGAQELWVKPVEPIVNGARSYAIVYFHRSPLGGPKYICETMSKLIGDGGLASSYDVYDLFNDNHHLGVLQESEQLCLYVNPSGSVRMVKAIPH